MDQIKFGKFMKELRLDKKMTQEEFAEKLGVSNKTISRWENGINMPNYSLIIQISEILNISILELISGERIKPENKEEKYEKIIINTFGNMDLNKKRLYKQMIIVSVIILIITCLIILLSNRIIICILAIALWIIASAFNMIFYVIAKDAGNIYSLTIKNKEKNDINIENQ